MGYEPQDLPVAFDRTNVPTAEERLRTLKEAEELGRVGYTNDSAPAETRKLGQRPFLSWNPDDSETSEGRVSHGGTDYSRTRGKRNELQGSDSPVLRSLPKVGIISGDNISLKEEETGGRSLLLTQYKGKQ